MCRQLLGAHVPQPSSQSVCSVPDSGPGAVTDRTYPYRAVEKVEVLSPLPVARLLEAGMEEDAPGCCELCVACTLGGILRAEAGLWASRAGTEAQCHGHPQVSEQHPRSHPPPLSAQQASAERQALAPPCARENSGDVASPLSSQSSCPRPQGRSRSPKRGTSRLVKSWVQTCESAPRPSARRRAGVPLRVAFRGGSCCVVGPRSSPSPEDPVSCGWWWTRHCAPGLSCPTWSHHVTNHL